MSQKLWFTPHMSNTLSINQCACMQNGKGNLCPHFAPPPQVITGCAAVCRCPPHPPQCAAGVSAVPDACGCCKVCAAQLNQDCNHATPCDHHKGLECNYGNDASMGWGICRGE